MVNPKDEYLLISPYIITPESHKEKNSPRQHTKKCI